MANFRKMGVSYRVLGEAAPASCSRRTSHSSRKFHNTGCTTNQLLSRIKTAKARLAEQTMWENSDSFEVFLFPYLLRVQHAVLSRERRTVKGNMMKGGCLHFPTTSPSRTAHCTRGHRIPLGFALPPTVSRS